MQKWVMLLAGGVCGTAARYLLAGTVSRWLGTGFPYGTLTVNGIGCFVIGLLSSLAEQKFPMSPDLRLFWIVGLLGAFTTFSTFIYESGRLLQNGELLPALLNLQGSLAVGLLALWLGGRLGALL